MLIMADELIPMQGWCHQSKEGSCVRYRNKFSHFVYFLWLFKTGSYVLCGFTWCPLGASCAEWCSSGWMHPCCHSRLLYSAFLWSSRLEKVYFLLFFCVLFVSNVGVQGCHWAKPLRLLKFIHSIYTVWAVLYLYGVRICVEEVTCDQLLSFDLHSSLSVPSTSPDWVYQSGSVKECYNLMQLMN